MAFPSNPSHGDIFQRFGRKYNYDSAKGKWSAVKVVPSSMLASYSINTLSDIDLQTTAPQDGETLVWNAAENKFVPGAASGGGAGVTAYATVSALPPSATNGELGYVSDTNKMYCYNGAVWVLVFAATTPNNAPAFVQGPRAGYVLATNGSPTVITLTAQDPEGAALNWSYAITDGSLTNGGGATATISQSDNVFTITPTTNTARGGRFTITFTASDGANIVNGRSRISLEFSTYDWSYGVKEIESIPLPYVNNQNANRNFGQSIAAHNGTLVVVGQAESSSSYFRPRLFIYDTTVEGSATLLQEYSSSGVANNWYHGNQTVAVHGDMIVANLNDTSLLVLYRNSNNSWEDVQTLQVSDVTSLGSDSVKVSISYDGLVMAAAYYTVATSISEPIEGRKLRIYTRASEATQTWTLVQTINGNQVAQIGGSAVNSAGIRDLGSVLKVSPTGKHIIWGGVNTTSPAAANPGEGAYFILTNEDVVNNNTWTFTAANHVVTGNNNRASVAHAMMFSFASTALEDFAYAYIPANTWDGGTGVDSPFMCLKYDNASNTWTRAWYNSNFAYYSPASSDLASNSLKGDWFEAVPIPGSDGITFITGWGKSVGVDYGNVCTIRYKYYDIVTHNQPTDDYPLSLSPGNYHANTLTQYKQYASTWYPAQTFKLVTANTNTIPLLALDRVTNDLFAASHVDSGTGTTGTGTVRWLRAARSTSSSSSLNTPVGGAFEVFVSAIGNAAFSNGTGGPPGGHNPSTGGFTITVPDGVYEMSCVSINSGSSTGAKATGNNAGSGAGGALVWFNNYPVAPGDTVTIWAGMPVTNSTAYNTVYHNGQKIFQTANTAGGNTQAGYSSGTFYLPVNGWVLNTDYALNLGGQGQGGTSSTNSFSTGGGGAGGYAGSGSQGASAFTSGGTYYNYASGGAGGNNGQYGYGTSLGGYTQSPTNSFETGNTYGYATTNYQLGVPFSQWYPATLGTGGWGRGVYGYYYNGSHTNGLAGGAGAIRVIFGQRNALFGASDAATSLVVRPIGYTL